MVKNPSANARDARDVQSPGQEDSLEEGMATHSSILTWRILWTEEPGGLQSIESHTEATYHSCMQTGSHQLLVNAMMRIKQDNVTERLICHFKLCVRENLCKEVTFKLRPK